MINRYGSKEESYHFPATRRPPWAAKSGCRDPFSWKARSKGAGNIAVVGSMHILAYTHSAKYVRHNHYATGSVRYTFLALSGISGSRSASALGFTKKADDPLGISPRGVLPQVRSWEVQGSRPGAVLCHARRHDAHRASRRFHLHLRVCPGAHTAGICIVPQAQIAPIFTPTHAHACELSASRVKNGVAQGRPLGLETPEMDVPTLC